MSKVEARIRARCINDGGCLVWQGATNAKGHPKLHNLSARRAMWQAAKGVALTSDQLVTVTCGNSLCLCVDHMALTSKSDAARRGNAPLAVKARRSAACAKTNQVRMGKLDAEKVQYIRSSSKTGAALAAELSVSKGLISNVRNHRGWKEYSNPFAGLL